MQLHLVDSTCSANETQLNRVPRRGRGRCSVTSPTSYPRCNRKKSREKTTEKETRQHLTLLLYGISRAPSVCNG
ncbi:hypothetical protein FOMPIDRAFT_161858 [Fomitopsis schrenkii]|uniref:Uncharacterized protein n=1 Tax=Fomitopsis schrenkii TaxID=2126942 RepID=S8FPR1_FOMSC|nr:hypothetical protein FOMPIDRAFT_161858 [Fomitopsis schrenkii]